MHELYTFNFLDTISEQLQESLDDLAVTALNPTTLHELESFQKNNDRRQGVYVINYEELPRYIGKANDVAERVSEHYEKLSGRQNINLARVGYKCLLLDNSMSTAANEDLLIARYREVHRGLLWNGKGFGPKDPGQERDTTKPNSFDSAYPIKLNITLQNISDNENIGSICSKMKSQLPYLFRYEKIGNSDASISLSGVPRLPEDLLQAIVTALGIGWRGAILKHGLVLYKNQKAYLHGKTINP